MRAHHFLLREYSRDVTAQKLGPALLAKFLKEPQTWQARIVGNPIDDNARLDRLLGHVEHADPTKNKQYVPWIARMYVSNPSLKFEDAVSKVTEPLLKFYKLVQKKQIPAPNNDIGRIKDLAGLVQVVDQYPDVVDQPKDVNRGQAKEVYRDQDLRVIMPEDETSACYYGQGTKWCTAATGGNNMFSRYRKEGPLYIIIPTHPAYNGEKYQFHFETKSFMNEQDTRISLTELVEQHPQLRQIFKTQAQANKIYGLMFSQEHLAQSVKAVNTRLMQEVPAIMYDEAFAKAKEVTREIVASNSVIRRFVDMSEVYELMIEAMQEFGVDLVKDIITDINGDLELYSDFDYMSDLASDNVVNWTRNQAFWELFEDLEEEDPDAFFDAAMTMDGEISSWVIKLMERVVDNAPELQPQ